MKKIFTLVLSFSFLFTQAQIGDGWDAAFNFGGAGQKVNEMRYDANGNLFFIATAMGKNVFAGVQIDPGGFGSFPASETIYGKIAPDGTQTLLKRFTGGDDGRLAADGSLTMILKAGFPTAPIDFGNGIVNNTNGVKIIKINNTGVAQWIKPVATGSSVLSGATGTASAGVAGMQFTPDGSFYAVVSASNVATNPPSQQFKYPNRVIKFNTDGDEVWNTTVFSAGNAGAITVPKIFVDDLGNVTFSIYTTTNQFYYNGEAIASQMGLYTSGPTSGYSIVICLNPDGSKKAAIADVGTNAVVNFKGLNPINGNLYIIYGAFAAASSTVAPFSTLPNATIGYNSAYLYTYNGLLPRSVI